MNFIIGDTQGLVVPQWRKSRFLYESFLVPASLNLKGNWNTDRNTIRTKERQSIWSWVRPSHSRPTPLITWYMFVKLERTNQSKRSQDIRLCLTCYASWITSWTLKLNMLCLIETLMYHSWIVLKVVYFAIAEWNQCYQVGPLRFLAGFMLWWYHS